LKWSRGHIQGNKRGVNNNLIIKEVDELSEFWNEILIPNLSKKYNVKNTHSLKEIILLKDKFVDGIR